jgi:lipopolysaccharide biosynthesis glycosyltransferase
VIIVSASDENFVPHFATMLHSAWFHNRAAEFYLLDCGIAAQTLETLEAFATKLGMRLTIAEIDTAVFSDLPTTTAWSVAVYARLMIAKLLPDASERAIYLDADCIVTCDLSRLWTTDVSSHLIAGVRDDSALENEHRYGVTDKFSGGLTEYVNAGVLLINLRAWREKNFGETVIDYVRRHDLRYGEQTAINIAASGRIKILSENWNFMLHKWQFAYNAAIKPSIIHYTGFSKPWLYRDGPFVPVYHHHRNLTPYPTTEPSTYYPSRFHFFLNLLFLRKKYWSRLLSSHRHDRAFSQPYLKNVADVSKTGLPS